MCTTGNASVDYIRPSSASLEAPRVLTGRIKVGLAGTGHRGRGLNMDSPTVWNDHPDDGHGVGTLGGRRKSVWERLQYWHGCWVTGLAIYFNGSSWGSAGQGSVGRGLVRLARSGTGEKSRQPGGRRPLVLDGFSSDGSRECSKSIEEQVSPREQRR